MALTKRILWIPGLLLSLAALSDAEDGIRFSRDVLPILSDRCFHCHGPDSKHREADLRLDVEEDAVGDGKTDSPIVRGKPNQSELFSRITSDDPDLMMPPPESNRKSLSEKEIKTLEQWIRSGAKWGRHWSFEQPVRPKIQEPDKHPVDALVEKALKGKGWRLASSAEKHTLIRRLCFDLTGLPPTLEQLAEYENDLSPNAFENLVDRILESPHFGERMAMWWLDAARYSDTDGYQGDATRNNWPWRDWVVKAFNDNMPFDQFTIEQFAGDLLPDATVDQKLATAFHRNHMTNGEGGRHPEESRIDYVIDRVNTTGTVWMGLTLGCTQCHSHKFDPISQKDYYSLFAFFDSIDEDGKAGGGAKPFLKYRSKDGKHLIEQSQKAVDLRKEHERQTRQSAIAEFEPWLKTQLNHTRSGFKAWHILKPSSVEAVEGTTLLADSNGIIQASGKNPRQDDYRTRFSMASFVKDRSIQRITGLRLEVIPHPNHTDGKLSRGKSGEFILTDVKLQVRMDGKSQVRDLELSGAVADAEKNVSGRNYGKVKDTLDDDPRNGWTTETHDPKLRHFAIYALDEPLMLDPGDELVFVMFHRSTRGDSNIGRFRISVSDQPGLAVRSLDPMPLELLAKHKPATTAEIGEKLRGRLLNQFLSDHGPYQKAKLQLDMANRQLAQFKRAAGDLNVMVLSERTKPRQTFVLERGVWDQKGEPVKRGFPSRIFSGGKLENTSRLNLAKWLVDRKNPLTARVLANHLWQICFGVGLVRTPDDFGLQGEFPTHPDLLDWLAVELMESNWDIKHLFKVIVTSRTYQQSSDRNPTRTKEDPENRLLGRVSRYRLPSWMIRDAALQASGLLDSELGGPTVMPYQPDGVWAEMFMGRFRYQPSLGKNQFRRTLYAFWRRSAAPTFLFDSSQRRVCEVKPRRTNTPLQALTLLNDLSILESSRAIASLAIAERKTSDDRIRYLFRRILSRFPSTLELSVLKKKLNGFQEFYSQSPDQAVRLLDFGQLENRVSSNHGEVAALTVVASLLFNLDESISRD